MIELRDLPFGLRMNRILLLHKQLAERGEDQEVQIENAQCEVCFKTIPHYTGFKLGIVCYDCWHPEMRAMTGVCGSTTPLEYGRYHGGYET